MTVLLQASGLSAGYGAAWMVQGLDLQVRRGEVVALMGRNGAGKSTTLKALIGAVKRSGQVNFMGQDLSYTEPYQAARLGLGYVPEDRRIFTDLTVMDNLRVGQQAPRHWPDGQPAPLWTPARLFELFPTLGAMTQRLGARMSGGEQQMLSVARTLMGNPLVLLLDEPSEGVAPIVVEQMVQMIQALKTQGVQRSCMKRLQSCRQAKGRQPCGLARRPKLGSTCCQAKRVRRLGALGCALVKTAHAASLLHLVLVRLHRASSPVCLPARRHSWR